MYYMCMLLCCISSMECKFPEGRDLALLIPAPQHLKDCLAQVCKMFLILHQIVLLIVFWVFAMALLGVSINVC